MTTHIIALPCAPIIISLLACASGDESGVDDTASDDAAADDAAADDTAVDDAAADDTGSTASDRNDVASPTDAMVRILHLVKGADSVDLMVGDSAAPLAEDLTMGASTPYSPFPPGAYKPLAGLRRRHSGHHWGRSARRKRSGHRSPHRFRPVRGDAGIGARADR